MLNERSAHDTMKVVDQLYTNGNLVAGSDPHEIIGEVEVIYRSKHNGQAVFTRKIRRNDLLVTGAVFLSEKINTIRSSYSPDTIDVLHGIHSVDDTFTIDNSGMMVNMNDVSTLPFERVCGIMVGRGGCGESYNQIHRVYRTDIEVPGIVPFRTISESDGETDLDEEERMSYFLRTKEELNGKICICYYGKRFSASREINVVWDDGNPVDYISNVPGNDRGKLVRTFTKYTAFVGPKDIREYCRIVEGTTIHSLVNSVGLITGFPLKDGTHEIMSPGSEKTYSGPYEFGYVRGLTTLNTEDYPLKDKESSMEIIYRLYFV